MKARYRYDMQMLLSARTYSDLRNRIALLDLSGIDSLAVPRRFTCYWISSCIFVPGSKRRNIYPFDSYPFLAFTIFIISRATMVDGAQCSLSFGSRLLIIVGWTKQHQSYQTTVHRSLTTILFVIANYGVKSHASQTHL